MSYRIEKIHNGVRGSLPTISVDVNDKNWHQALRRWKMGKTPTDSPEWKYGVVAETSMIYWYICCNQKLIAVFTNRYNAESKLYSFAVTYPNNYFYVVGMTHHEYKERANLDYIKWDFKSKIPSYQQLIPPKNHSIFSAITKNTQLHVIYENHAPFGGHS